MRFANLHDIAMIAIVAFVAVALGNWVLRSAGLSHLQA